MEVPASIQRHSFMSFSGNFHPLPYANPLFLFLSAQRRICALSFCCFPLNTLSGLHAAYVNEAFFCSLLPLANRTHTHPRFLTHTFSHTVILFPSPTNTFGAKARATNYETANQRRLHLAEIHMDILIYSSSAITRL